MVVCGIALFLFAGLVLADAEPLLATAPLPESVQDTTGRDASKPGQRLEGLVDLMLSDEVAWPRGPVAHDPSVAPSSKRAGSTLPGPLLSKRPPVAPSPKRSGSILIDMAQSKDPSTRLSGLEGLAQTCPAEQLERFIEALADPEPTIRALAEGVLARCAPDVLFETVMNILCAGPDVRAVAVQEALPALRTSIRSKMLAVVESDEEPLVRRETAAYCLGRMGGASAIPVLAKCAWSPEPAVALSGTRALVTLRDPLVVPQLVRLTENPIADVRYTAMDGLARVGGPLATNALGRIALTSRHEDEPANYAVSLLGALKDEAAIPVLIEVMRKNLRARRAAARALYEITGEDLGDLPSDWIAWYEERLRAPHEPAQGGIGGAPPFQVEALE